MRDELETSAPDEPFVLRAIAILRRRAMLAFALFALALVAGVAIAVTLPDLFRASAVVLVETPRLMFPFARNIVAETTRDGGFPPLMINPIDFSELLRRNAAQPQAGQPATPPPGGAVA